MKWRGGESWDLLSHATPHEWKNKIKKQNTFWTIWSVWIRTGFAWREAHISCSVMSPPSRPVRDSNLGPPLLQAEALTTQLLIYSYAALLLSYATPLTELYATPLTCLSHTLPSNRVISSPFTHRTFYSTKFHEGTLYFFSGSKFIKKVV